MWQDRPEIEGGVGWWRQIETALERVEFLVSVMTPAALASEVTAREWRGARQRGVCVFPVQGPGFDFADPRLPRWMAKAHFYALDTQWETFLAHLQRGCQTTWVPFMAPDLPIGFVQRPKQFESMRHHRRTARLQRRRRRRHQPGGTAGEQKLPDRGLPAAKGRRPSIGWTAQTLFLIIKAR